jgi:alanyl-tRNA synthetase
VVAERDANFKEVRSLLQKLAEMDAAATLQSTSASGSSTRTIVRAFGEDTQPDYPGFFTTQLAKTEGVIALVGLKGSGQIVFAQHPSVGKDLNALLKRTFERFAGKGGGNRDFARGRLADGSNVDRALKLAHASLEEQSQASAGRSGSLSEKASS